MQTGEELMSPQRKQDAIAHKLIVEVAEFFAYLGCESATRHVSGKHNLQPMAPLGFPLQVTFTEQKHFVLIKVIHQGFLT